MILEEWKGSKMLLDGCLGCIDVVDGDCNTLLY